MNTRKLAEEAAKQIIKFPWHPRQVEHATAIIQSAIEKAIEIELVWIPAHMTSEDEGHYERRPRATATEEQK